MPYIALTATAMQGYTESIQDMFSEFTTANVGDMITGALTIALPLFIFWVVYRFIKARASGAFISGKL